MATAKVNQRLMYFLLKHSGCATQEQLAKAIGINRGYLGNALNGKAVSLKAIKAIADHFCITTDQLQNQQQITSDESLDHLLVKFRKKHAQPTPPDVTPQNKAKIFHFELSLKTFGRTAVMESLQSYLNHIPDDAVIIIKGYKLNCVIYAIEANDVGVTYLLTRFVERGLQEFGIYEIAGSDLYDVLAFFQTSNPLLSTCGLEQHKQVTVDGKMVQYFWGMGCTLTLSVNGKDGPWKLASTLSSDNIDRAEQLFGSSISSKATTSAEAATESIHFDNALLRALSPVELEILSYIKRGRRTTIDIGNAIFKSPNTIRTHLASIMFKLGFNSREDLFAWVRGDQTSAESPRREDVTESGH